MDKSKKKWLAVLSKTAILGLILTTASSKAAAKPAAIDINGKDSKVYEYQLEALKDSALAEVLNGKSDSAAKLYNDFIQRRMSTKAYYDDVRNAYVSFDVISKAAIDAALSGGTKKFDFKTFMEDTGNPTITVDANKVTVDENGNVAVKSPFGNNTELSDGGIHASNYEISTTGTFGASDAAKVTTISGHISIKDVDASESDSIVLQNLNIKGTLNVDFGEGSVKLYNVKVNGINITNVGSHSLGLFGESVADSADVNDSNSNARVLVADNSRIGRAVAHSGARFEIASGATNPHPFTEVVLAPADKPSPSNAITFVGGKFDKVTSEKPANAAVEAGATLQSVVANSNLTFSGVGSITKLELPTPNTTVQLPAAPTGTVLVTAAAVGSRVIVPTGGTVGTLNANAAVAISGSGSIGTANLGASGVTMETRPTNIGVTAGVTATVAGQTVNSSNATVITAVPTDSTPAVPVVTPPSGGGYVPPANAAGATITTAAVAASKTSSSITITAAEASTNPGSQNIEYAISTNGTTSPTSGWQAGLTFTGLNSSTGYYVWARTAGKTGYNAGTAVVSSAITTDAAANAAGAAITTAAVAASKTSSSITITAAGASTNPGSQSVEYAISTNGSLAPTSGWQASLTFSGLNASTGYYVWARTAGKTGYDAGTAVASAAITTDAAANAAGAAITTPAAEVSKTSSSITVTAAAASTNPGSQSVEYAISTNGSLAPTSGWQADLTFSGLNASTGYYVWARTAGKTGYDAGTAVVSAAITTDAAANAAGAAITTPAVAASKTSSSITITAAAASTNPGSQSVEYAISTNGSLAPTSGWQADLTFSGLNSSTGYYVWARTAGKTGYDAGTAVVSAAITTDAAANAAGAAITTPAVAASKTSSSITITAAAASTNPGSQSVEYAISTNGSLAPTSGWQADLTFSGLNASTGYYVWARAAGKTGYNAGTAVVSAAITTDALADLTSPAFTTTATNNAVAIMLNEGIFKTGTIGASDFTFTGTDATALAAGTFTRENDMVVRITGVTLKGGADNVVVVKGEAQAVQAASVVVASGTVTVPLVITAVQLHDVTSDTGFGNEDGDALTITFSKPMTNTSASLTAADLENLLKFSGVVYIDGYPIDIIDGNNFDNVQLSYVFSNNNTTLTVTNIDNTFPSKITTNTFYIGSTVQFQSATPNFKDLAGNDVNGVQGDSLTITAN